MKMGPMPNGRNAFGGRAPAVKPGPKMPMIGGMPPAGMPAGANPKNPAAAGASPSVPAYYGTGIGATVNSSPLPTRRTAKTDAR